MNVEAKIPYSVTSSSKGILPKPLFLKNTSVVKRRAIEAIIKLEKMQLGDVKETTASIRNLNKISKKKNFIKLEKGIKHYIEWFKKKK